MSESFQPAAGLRVGRRSLLAAGIGSAAIAMIPQAARAASPQSGPHAKHVVLVGWDGFDPEYLDRVDTPNLHSLARQGSLSTSTGVFPSITNSAWSSIVTGAWPQTHHNTPYYLDQSTGLAVSQSRTLDAQSIAEVVTAAGGTFASVQFFILQNHGAVYGDPRALYVQPGGKSKERTDVAIDILHGRPVKSSSATVTVDQPPTLLALYADDMDALGHAEGSDSPNMAPTLASLDNDLGRLVQATKDVGIYGETAFVLLGDHGMTTFTHGFGGSVLAALTNAGFTPEFVSPGKAPAAATDLAMVVGGVANVYLLGTARTDAGIARAKAVLESIEQVQHVYDRADLDRFHSSPLLGQLVAEPIDGWSFAASDPAKPAGYHGRFNEIQSALLIAGRGVLNGVAPAQARHVDMAPTIATLLGIPAPAQSEGRVLTEVLHPQVAASA